MSQQLDLDKDLCLYTLHLARPILHDYTPLPSVIINLLLAYCSIYELEPPQMVAELKDTYNDPEIQQLLHPQNRITQVHYGRRQGATRMLVKFCLLKEIECKAQGIPMPKILFSSGGSRTRNNNKRILANARRGYKWMMKDNRIGYTTFVRCLPDSTEEKEVAEILLIDNADFIRNSSSRASRFGQVVVCYNDPIPEFISGILREGEKTTVFKKDMTSPLLPGWFPVQV